MIFGMSTIYFFDIFEIFCRCILKRNFENRKSLSFFHSKTHNFANGLNEKVERLSVQFIYSLSRIKRPSFFLNGAANLYFHTQSSTCKHYLRYTVTYSTSSAYPKSLSQTEQVDFTHLLSTLLSLSLTLQRRLSLFLSLSFTKSLSPSHIQPSYAHISFTHPHTFLH